MKSVTRNGGALNMALAARKVLTFEEGARFRRARVIWAEYLRPSGSIPAPTLRFKEGEDLVINVTNTLAVDSSIHWHGLILPAGMDGVPGISFDGIRPGETFTYQFDVRQNGTFWYHSHSGFQEQTGMYGSIVIEPREADPVGYDRDYGVLLSDWSDEKPERIYAKLKKQSD